MVKRIQGIIFSLAFFFLGILLIWISVFLIEEKLDFQKYTYDLEISSSADFLPALNDFLLDFDFSGDEYIMSFEINQIKKGDAIIIHFPHKLLLNNLVVNLIDKEQNLVRNNFSEGVREDYLIIDDFEEDLEDMTIKIRYRNAGIQPEGIFDIYSGSLRIYDGRYGVQVKLGKKYECQPNCLIKFKNVEESLESNPLFMKLRFTDEGGTGQKIFILHAKHKYALLFNQIFFGLGIALMASALLFFFETMFFRIKN